MIIVGYPGIGKLTLCQHQKGKTSNNIDEANKVCGLCKHFFGMGDWNLCCDKKYDLTYDFNKPCDMFEEK